MSCIPQNRFSNEVRGGLSRVACESSNVGAAYTMESVFLSKNIMLFLNFRNFLPFNLVFRPILTEVVDRKPSPWHSSAAPASANCGRPKS